MTPYEIVAICLSSIAILIPIVQLVWKKWITKPKLNYYPNGKITLFFNQSGSYVRLDGAVEAINKSISIKKINVQVIRCSDDKHLNLTWSCFISPISQKFAGVFSNSTETAHPFRIPENEVSCIFTEFSDGTYSVEKRSAQNTKKLFSIIPTLKNTYSNYEQALEKYKTVKDFDIATQDISKEFFWDIGKYKFNIEFIFLNKSVKFEYEFDINETEYNGLKNNIEESLVYPLKDAYTIQRTFYTSSIEIRPCNN